MSTKKILIHWVQLELCTILNVSRLFFFNKKNIKKKLFFIKFFFSIVADSEGSISMQEDETFDVIELDQGDGWTKVLRENLEEGFVPTSYLEINLGN